MLHMLEDDQLVCVTSLWDISYIYVYNIFEELIIIEEFFILS